MWDDAKVPVKSLVQRILQQEEEWAANPSNVRGIPTGFSGLDDLTAGWSPGEVVVLMAYTSVGKTALLNQWMFESINYLAQESVQAGKITGSVLCFSPEMTGDQLLMRQASAWSGVSSWDIYLGRTTPEARERWRKEFERLAYYDRFLHLYAGSSMDTTFIDTEVSRLMLNEPKPRIMFVDYIQRVDGVGQKFSITSDTSRMLKNIANRYEIPVLALSQVTVPDGDESKMPTIYQVRDSRDIVQDADKVLILHRLVRDEKLERATRSAAKLKLAKNRHGPLGTLDLVYYHKVMKFEQLVEEMDLDAEEATLSDDGSSITPQGEGL